VPHRRRFARREVLRLLGGLAGLGWLIQDGGWARGDDPSPRPTRRVPVTRTPERVAASEGASASAPAKHPLDAPLERLYSCRETMKKVKDYTCTFARREEVRGDLTDYEYIYLKCRNEPFAVYLYWVQPHAGREAIFAEGKYDGRLIVHETGLKDAVAGTIDLDPHGERAMKNSRHPITEAGITKMIDQFIEGAERERRYGECEVQFFKNAKVDGRTCSWFEIKHPVLRRQFLYHVLRVYIDDELNLPIRMEAYDWPRRRNEKARLIEEYTFMKLKLNVGLTELDFDTRNQRYAF
jgi:hypothetical protein